LSCGVEIFHTTYTSIPEILSGKGIKADGLLLDLGVSSHQLDTAERGFSFHSDAPLDMRMSKQGMSAYDVVNTYDERDIMRILRDYGEEKFASRIARNIVQYREEKPIETTLELADIIKNAIPAATRRTGGHPAKRSFQAIRIEVNGELQKLQDTLDDMFSALGLGGRLAIITFHSLEDRIVKKAFQNYCKGCECPPQTPVCICGKTPEGKLPFKKKTASKEELEENMRSRSATLRSVEKIK
ncbi:MAG: 16S rRNA (cytosine(1402)-N(4))-methyltransferase RsmH, partial [Clostridia bacterium]|nr:16S rRNA (cytosine(1402)-N(4))-methyltransferase RsmH [Clostridia bacterium]